ncbi:hypothetical protein ACOSQ2_021020 [Xanthoceras sorbifolium]
MQVDILCRCCCYVPKTAFHALWQCGSLNLMRQQCLFLHNKIRNLASSASFIDFFVMCCSLLFVADLRLLVVVLWRCWYRRNKLLHENIVLPAIDIVAWSSNFLHEFDAVNSATSICSPGNQVAAAWMKPPDNWVKVNTDTALRLGACLVGLGDVIRDANGLFLAGISRKLIGSVAVEVAGVAIQWSSFGNLIWVHSYFSGI